MSVFKGNKMFKLIPGTYGLSISQYRKIINQDGTECTLPVKDNLVQIHMYGKDRWLDINWLALLAQFEVNLPYHLIPNLWNNIDFEELDPSLKIKKLNKTWMVFKRPIIVHKDYRLVPGYTGYAVSSNGEVIDANTLKIIKTQTAFADYSNVFIYDPLKNKERNVKVHRLVALAWVKNPDNRKFYLVNHINGIRGDNRKENLEWVDYAGNIRHAFDNGLRADNVPCKVRNAYTKEVTEFTSMSQAAVFMGVPGGVGQKSKLLGRLKSRLIKGKYEFKLASDDTPWFYEDKDGPVEASRYILNTVEEDGTPRVFHGIRDFIKHYKLWNMGSTSLACCLERMSEVRPGVSISLTDNYTVKPFQAKNVQTGEVFEAKGSRELAAMLGVSRKVVFDLTRTNGGRVFKGYVFRHKSDEPWRDDFVEAKHKPWCIAARHVDTGDLLEFKSLREAGRHFNVDRLTIQRAMKAGCQVHGWLLENKVI